MFKVEFYFGEFSGRKILGIEALDIRRKLKLKDDCVIKFSEGASAGYIEVSEAYARRRFPKNNLIVSLEIPNDHLTPEDVEEVNGEVRLKNSEFLLHHLECPLVLDIST